MIKNIISVFKRDVRNIIKNRAARIIIIGMCVMPCLYTLVNVKAIWNPYSSVKLSDISIAVVNKDSGAVYQNKNVNMGNDIVDNLKKNHNIGWKIVDSQEADQGMMDGKYYAMIEIPENFSSNLTSITTDDPRKAQILYKADTKVSPMGTKITENAAKTLVDSIKSNFVYTVNKTIFSSLNVIGKDADKNKSQIIDLKDSIITLSDNMDLVTTVLGNITDGSNNLALLLTQLKPVISASNNVDIASQTSSDNTALVKSVQSSLEDSFDNIQVNLNNAKADNYRLQALVTNLNSLTGDANSSNINSTTDKINYQIYMLNSEINPAIDFLQTINKFAHNSSISSLLNSLNDVKDLLNTEKNNVNNLQKGLNDTNGVSSSIKNSISENTQNVSTKLIDSTSKYANEVRGQLNPIANDLINVSNSSSDILKTAKDINNQGSKSIDTLIDGTKLAASSSGKLENQLLKFKDSISQTSDKLKLINNDDIVKIITVLQNNPELMGNFISNPFNIKEENIYTVPNFGSAFAPTYMTLSIWVGCTMLAAMLKTTVAKFKGYENLNLREKYFGKMLLFVSLSIIQSLVIVFTTKFILHIYTENFFLMIMFGLASSLAFSTIVYSLVSIFGNLGKAMAVILVVVQLAGSGAMYPIQLSPRIFRILQPMFPFTYSVSGFRESIGGPLISTVVMDFSVLFLMFVIAILAGIFLKRPLYGMSSKLHDKFIESGIGE
ncbi:MAG: YhgE/Pip domain-containing protein [Clostridium tyrobutyricum]|jgi:putative membrane protein|uniref:YhgE/Pip domain-containing protein n=2 Tax=Clostridium tyrobutyricum TaxID=1519 RepID=UPI00242C1E30|nr:YhgE/Pip domain-containing protein [Clostridium tyrobutyricum]MCH4199989.1 YhgE/Pip domain-containing protein [Clostridium tyrobutyricum]MCH4237564.1 YhgE/Pip domain-containing protein [Clostridium tyrobutyricum]MCH4259980.1 YhgE/Pip domain-containing protein [Clostridium tyrobutyricum]MCI1240295.1 YhgE/Pip domain-containing protein [Clostridium tyrobutyricum]MCI1653101.1 YhgE/Pip domain-containing protein [Clostridium tyrobutyricum]